MSRSMAQYRTSESSHFVNRASASNPWIMSDIEPRSLLAKWTEHSTPSLARPRPAAPPGHGCEYNAALRGKRRAMARPVIALVTAYNEAPTIGPVLDAVLACPLVTRVQVIDDASEDETAAVARSRSQVRVISLPQRVPVGDALLSHLRHVEEKDAIIF